MQLVDGFIVASSHKVVHAEQVIDVRRYGILLRGSLG